jgi:uncharacterized protein (DUF2147 family)
MTNIKQVTILLVLLIFYGSSIVAQTTSYNSDAILGTWLMPDNEGILEVFKENELYHGKIIWLKKTEDDGSPLKDKENPDENLRDREVIGLQVMNNFKYEGENIWNGGTFYAARKGREAEPDLILVNPNQLNIKISILIFSKTIPLTRIDTAQYFKENY